MTCCGQGFFEGRLTSGFDADGFMAWADSLTSGGYTDWLLAKNDPIDGTTADDLTQANDGGEDYGYNVSTSGTAYEGGKASEMAHLFYNTLMTKCGDRI